VPAGAVSTARPADGTSLGSDPGNSILGTSPRPAMTALHLPVPSGAASSTASAAPANKSQILESYGQLPLRFEANQGQTDAQVKFLSLGSADTLFLTGTEAVLSLRPAATQTNASAADGVLH